MTIKGKKEENIKLFLELRSAICSRNHSKRKHPKLHKKTASLVCGRICLTRAANPSKRKIKRDTENIPVYVIFFPTQKDGSQSGRN